MIGEYCLDIDNHAFKHNGVYIELTPAEFSVIELLFKNQGNVVSKKEIATKLYGETTDETRLKKEYRTIDMYVKTLRQKLDDNKRSFIVTVFNCGFKID
jgi:DNA-binding response OmpR family regulator